MVNPVSFLKIDLTLLSFENKVLWKLSFSTQSNNVIYKNKNNKNILRHSVVAHPPHNHSHSQILPQESLFHEPEFHSPLTPITKLSSELYQPILGITLQ